ncbi:MAG: ABC transporter permease [Proteobacteria bacterium]|nr:ABC transporter permease [Pseudomonadota bacterium]
MKFLRTRPPLLNRHGEPSPTMNQKYYAFQRAFKTHCDVIGAIIIRDIHGRMLGNKFSYLKVIFVPLGHLIYLSAFYAFLGRGALLGTDRMVFFASGILPFMIYLYPVRSIVMSIIDNRALLMFPLVRPMDLVIGRSLLEMINSFIIIIILFFGLYILGFSAIPKAPFETITGILITVAFTISFCIPNAIIASMVHGWVQFCVLYCVALYITSGALFLPSHMPKEMVNFMYFNPLAHCVEWVRSGYYETYKEGILDKRYIFVIIVLNLLVGFWLERIFRGKLR